MMRIGMGYDIHRLVPGRKLVLGGVTIPFEKGLLGHSDADVLVHAVCDALLGAAGLGDIGLHFPDTDPKYKDINSLRLLSQTADLVRRNGYQLRNVDTTLLAEQPRLAPYRSRMQLNLAQTLQVEPGLVNIKATTAEGLGIIGKGDAIAAMSVVLVE
jgi:2-C-methyl-D-erythritol 2,4-cyclodiphosphate synthase